MLQKMIFRVKIDWAWSGVNNLRIVTYPYYILLKREPYKDLGANYLDQQGKEQLLTRLCRSIKQLGYQVSLQLSSESTP